MENCELLRFLQEGDVSGVNACLHFGGSIDGADAMKPLVAACVLEDINMVEFLVEKGANINAMNND